MLLNTCFFSPLWLRANARRSCHWWPSFRGKKNWKQKTCSTGGKGSLTSDTRDDFDLVINRHQHTQVHPPISPNNQLPPPPPPTFTEQVTIFYLYVKVPDMGRWCNRHLKINQLYVQTREPWDAPPGDKDPQEYRPLYFMSRQVHNITSDTPHALYPFSLNLAIYIYMTLFSLYSMPF